MQRKSAVASRRSSRPPSSAADRDQAVAVGMDRRQLRPEADVDHRVVLDPLDEVGGHALGEAVAAHEHRHACGRSREIQHRLAGRVAGADDGHRLAAALDGLASARAVVDAAPEQIVHPGDVEPAPDHSRRGEHGGGFDLDAAVDEDVDLLVGSFSRLRGLRAGTSPRRRTSQPADPPAARAQRRRYRPGSRRSSRSSKCARPGRPGRRARGRSSRAVRGGIDGGGEPGRAGADDHDIKLDASAGRGGPRRRRSTRPSRRRGRCSASTSTGSKELVERDPSTRSSASAEPASSHSCGCAARVRRSPEAVVLRLQPPADDSNRRAHRTDAVILP